YHKDGKQSGPVPAAALRQLAARRELAKDTPVWTPGMGQWLAAGQVRDLLPGPGLLAQAAARWRRLPLRGRAVAGAGLAACLLLGVTSLVLLNNRPTESNPAGSAPAASAAGVGKDQGKSGQEPGPPRCELSAEEVVARAEQSVALIRAP